MKKRVSGIVLASVFAMAALGAPVLGAQGGNSADANCDNGGAMSNNPPGWVKNQQPSGYPAGYFEHADLKAGGQLSPVWGGEYEGQAAFWRC